MNTAFLSLGGNLHERADTLFKARLAILKQCGTIVKASSLFETEAWGTSSENAYLNQVVEIRTALSSKSLLSELLSIETSLGRKRTEDRYADRVIDLDVLFYNGDCIRLEHLTVPHPQLEFRKFVLVPLCEIAPTLLHPVLKKTVRELLENCKDTLNVRKLSPVRLPRYICIEGNIGSGKTSLAKVLAPHLGAFYLQEQYEDCRLLPLFYKEPSRYAFALEFSFLLNRFEHISACFEAEHTRIISDYSLFKSLCFAKVNLKQDEFQLFEKQFQTILQKLPEPDFIIHLNAHSDLLLQNISKRSRNFETQISKDYLHKVSSTYEKTFGSLTNIPQLFLTVDRYHSELEKEHIEKIEHFIFKIFAEKY
ncbi:MAG: 2-amino-4-hydroxy-6-hydroxymethyldihydropteridine diphosphokinase [Bacteroidia bacterium]|jgi:2-amino-4-hydroxy-6-hydroxymethyldihydropteridine diphosphokinase|nr:2-amino-4-hydroxy-6-hydroxymethyldihydropteridine diphosphokinase [Bacteroidia bacterium]